MSKEEIKEYLKRVDELLNKLNGEDKDTLEWMMFGYNQCAKILHEKDTTIDKAIEYIKLYGIDDDFDLGLLEILGEKDNV